ncbi:MAG: hypothetical protein COX77_04480 [Candidatus Komeilibacteria bacterium CG_4_10_14_0_2_um_filter_37_10]|uniref:Uncharacterized protein n=1 Tax=Candidatus Komeilibacteria bacterium CG_4_10_14_0_2_um_filter_37_10 TaxID=1974470 RepID=A0A2M7VDE8_9BACT|nr:MAG: hypothetical protein COX77_04480 [Candidatus Komeilibacteria bacterium CG_4_10_14_0_2_um_filter_37_10]PJA92473.1 MAG: hypothetical protein CO133_03035 [Candidatus Komeilibacteria bacterium CG_4_9_14_3_um_filter_37_5]
MKERIIAADIFKAGAIILMVLDHLVLITFQSNSIWLAIFFAYIPFVQFAFLFISGYLLAYNFKFQQPVKYIKRVLLLIVLFIITTYASNETLSSSGVILLAFAIMTAISWIFLEKKWQLGAIILCLLLFFSNFLLQWPFFAQQKIITDWLLNYSYPINSFGVYFLLGIIYYWYQASWSHYSNIFIIKVFTWFILLFYPVIFYQGIAINQYDKYLHLPLLIIATAIAGLYLFRLAGQIQLNDWWQSLLARISQVMLALYVGHYIFIFGLLPKLNLPAFFSWLLTLLWIAGIVIFWPRIRSYFLRPAKNKSSCV